eukprot:TRINITY_DN59109_c0_g1_i1.p1 TRINITY_DN59109_c0_g1~~TRINITY_DN59109_c0_g1_i1.p1  ORF type:complete len:448 (-),score=19.51 TRINITY_DN59109_c0_g1_i1:236-1432(-)
MPRNHTQVLTELQNEHTHIRFHTVRLETMPMVKQIELANRLSVFVGPPGSNMVNTLFMREGAAVIELFPGGDIDSYRVSRPTDAEVLCEYFKLKYDFVESVEPAKRYERHMEQPLFPPESLWKKIKPALGSLKSKSKFATEDVFLSQPLIGCQGMFHVHRARIFMGWYKQTYIIPNQFALKLPRKGWKKLLSEMLVLRNLTDHLITPAVSLCFDTPAVQYAQLLFRKTLRWEKNMTKNSPKTFFTAMAGWTQMWKAHRWRGRFLFYCDSGPKNWAMSRANKLTMYDFDATLLIVPGALCGTDADCGCGGNKEQSSACVKNRCDYKAMERKIDNLVGGWIRGAIRGMTTREIRHDAATKELERIANAGEMTLENLEDYIIEHSKGSGVDLCYLGIKRAC